MVENIVLVDGELENCCGCKFYFGMMVEVLEVGIFFMVKKGNDDNEVE